MYIFTYLFFFFSLVSRATWKFWKQRRYVVAILAFFGFFNIYSLRVNLSIAIVAMTEVKSVTLSNGSMIYVSKIKRFSLVYNIQVHNIIHIVPWITFVLSFQGSVQTYLI